MDGLLTRPGEVLHVNHAGPTCRVDGQHLIGPSPQRTPKVFS